MQHADTPEHDRLSPETVHHFQTLLSHLRIQEQMVQRWLRRQGAGGDLDVMRQRLAIIDATVVQLATEITAREAKPTSAE